jgi:hypothetical protein
MRIPFIRRRERTIEEIAAKATRVGSAEGYPSRLGPNNRTVAENREAIERMRRIRANHGLP